VAGFRGDVGLDGEKVQSEWDSGASIGYSSFDFGSLEDVLRYAWMGWVMAVVTCVPVGMRAQAATADAPAWETAAGGKMEFEVASVRLDKGEFRTPSFALSSDDWFREPNGRFHADFGVVTYIEFAYKIWPTGEEERGMLAGMPAWVKEDRYAIEATAPLHATKDQYRLMMQALLKDRFGLKIHFDEREMPVLAMTLVKPGVPGPKLIPHDKGPSCDLKPGPELYPSMCYSFSARPKDGLALFGSRATSIELIGKFLGNTGGRSGDISRPVVDQTGLTGLWDFTLLVASPFGPPKPDAPPVEGPTLLEGMQEQLGIKLKPTKAMLREPVVDSVERPTEN
jgi:uncharacterized protein (TIGR03435 family)